MPAIRDVVSFGGHALAGPLLVLCLWAGVSAVVLALPRPRLPRSQNGQPLTSPVGEIASESRSNAA
jgi:hypothetical protein